MLEENCPLKNVLDSGMGDRLLVMMAYKKNEYVKLVPYIKVVKDIQNT